MTRASAPAASGAAIEFADGLGERALQVDAATGETVEVFRLNPALTAVPSFEFALRERAARLVNFRHPHFARVRRIDRAGDRLAVVSDHVAGTRLAAILRLAAERRIPVDTNAALCLIRQLVPAVALLHENARDVAHGAIAPERLVITPQARLVVAEYVLGSALERLQLTHDRLWRDYRIAMPPTAGVPRFDHRADVMQIGMTALALLLGRPLADDEGPGRASAELVLSVTETTPGGARQPLSLPLRGWLARALQLDPRHSFATAAEAQAALEQVLASHTRYLASTVAVEAFLSTCTDSVIEVAAGAPPAP
ncbi:MAG TPA: hypothetical protein VNK92_04070, partial [Vicinamibacterales bacterium]|nr:hypothetical protein [Vicinamibacterales bacterium]